MGDTLKPITHIFGGKLKTFKKSLNVMRCAIWYQTFKSGVRLVGQNAVLTSYNAFEWLSQESVSLNLFAWHFKLLVDI